MAMCKPFDVHYADGRTSLVMKADLDRGWKELQKTWGFFGQTRVPYHNDLTIRAQLVVIAQPATFDDWARTFPQIDAQAGDDDLSYELRDKRLTVKVALMPHQPWRLTPQGRVELFVEQLPFLQTDGLHWYDLRAWIVFHESSQRPVTDVRIWAESNLILPGGQFESNRRRH